MRTIVEIGSGAGDGSTRSFVAGATKRTDPPTLFCIETVESRAAELRKRYADKPYVICYVAASAGPDDYLSEQTAVAYQNALAGARSAVSPEQVVLARNYELNALASTGIRTNAIEQIRADHGIEHFDVALLDGSGFTGQHDLAQVYGARWLLLDDTTVMKNLANCVALVNDPKYRLVAANPDLRNGYAVFERVDG